MKNCPGKYVNDSSSAEKVYVLTSTVSFSTLVIVHIIGLL